MIYKVTLLNVETGERVAIPYNTKDRPWDEGDSFVWSEGNHSCDCNRELFYWRAMGVEPTFDSPCGDSRFKVVEITPGIADYLRDEVILPTRYTV